MNKFNPFENFMKYMKRNFTTFDMSNFVQTSMNLGELNPVRRDFVIPSDFWRGTASSAVMLPPLTAPAFTRINGLLQSFYVSYPSIWKYWNQFISNRPSDGYLNSANLSKFDGVYQEPCIPMQFIQILCKIYYGYFGLKFITTTDSQYGNAGCLYVLNSDMYQGKHFKYIFHLNNGLRAYDLDTISNPSTDLDTYFGVGNLLLFERVTQGDESTDAYNSNSFARRLGFFNYFSFVYHQIGSAVKFFKNNGLPTELIAASSFRVYSNELINALPFIAQSKIWNDFFRNSTVQGAELNYFEVNGCLAPVYDRENPSGNLSQHNFSGISQYGWNLRLNDIPFGYTDSTYINVYSRLGQTTTHMIDYRRAMAVLTGIGLRTMITSSAGVQSSFLALLPQYYNGLCVTKYRNFEEDYFTSAAPDPMMGRQSISVPGTLEELRSASKLEEFLESNTAARNFYDFLKHRFGTTAKSVLFERPEFLGSSKVAVQISENLQTSQTTQGENGSPLGTRGGVASGYASDGSLIRRNFDEHGIVITYLSFYIDSQYYQGKPLELTHHDSYFDLPWPEFSNLGLERINNKELYFGDVELSDDYYDGTENLAVAKQEVGSSLSIESNITTPDPSSSFGLQTIDRVFGYTPRYSKYKYKMDQLSGDFTSSLSYWNTFRRFKSLPHLSHNFISYENAVFMSDLDRIFAVTDDLSDKFQVDLYFDYSVSRCLPLVANPMLD